MLAALGVLVLLIKPSKLQLLRKRPLSAASDGLYRRRRALRATSHFEKLYNQVPFEQ